MPQQPPFAQGQYNTSLPLLDELAFRSWVNKNGVPFDLEAPVTDYDMRGYWRGLRQGNPMALSPEVNSNDGRIHYPDYYKTPLHKSFAGPGGPYVDGSQWAGPDAPQWINGSQLAAPSGRIIVDEAHPQMGSIFGQN